MSICILIVDDNVDAAATLCKLLSMMGNNCHFALTASKALEIAPILQPDLVLLDVEMKSTDGFTLQRQLQEFPELKTTKMVAHSAFSDLRHRRIAKSEGFDDYLVKPGQLDTLFDLVAHAESMHSVNGDLPA